MAPMPSLSQQLMALITAVGLVGCKDLLGAGAQLETVGILHPGGPALYGTLCKAIAALR